MIQRVCNASANRGLLCLVAPFHGTYRDGVAR